MKANTAARTDVDIPAHFIRGVEADQPWPPRRYAWYVAAVLTCAYTLSFIDRQVLGLVLEPIRRQLHLTDTQVSLLAGSAFALFYVTLGLPLGRLADRASRRNLILVGIFFWSLMTVACGLASSFWQLFAARVGVGIGEAALSPAALSMISDYFPPEKRARPLAMYTLALAVGSGLAYMLGGSVSAAVAAMPHFSVPLIGHLEAWQATFVAVGAPGMIFALILLTIREPLRRGIRRPAASADKSADIPVARARDVLDFIWKENRRTFVVLFFGYSGFTLYADSVIVWMPTVFARRFGWTAGEIGMRIGSVLLVCATVGILASMAIASRFQAKGSPDALMRTSLLMGLALTPLGILLPLTDSPTMALAVMAPVVALSFGLYAMVPPMLQLITPNQMRAQVSAVFSLFNNVIGLMIGATSVALLTDYVFHDAARVHHSLAVVAAIVLPLSTYLAWRGLPHLGRSVLAAQSWMRSPAGEPGIQKPRVTRAALFTSALEDPPGRKTPLPTTTRRGRDVPD
jgi:MFS family permease